MLPVFADGIKDTFLKPYGISEDAVTAIVAKPEQGQVVAWDSAGGAAVTIFAGRAQGDGREHVILIIGTNSGEQLQVAMAFKVPPQVATPAGATAPPLKMLEGLVELCGVPVVVGQHMAKFIVSDRIPIPAGDALRGPVIANVANSRLMTSWAVRPFTEAGQTYADCALCFAIDIEAYERALGLRLAPSRPDPAMHQISVVLDEGAKLTMPIAGVSAERVIETVRQRDRGMLVRSDKPIIHALRWFGERDIVFISGAVTKSRTDGGGIWVDEVRVLLALSVCSNLPAGTFDRSTEMAQILPIIAKSFGTRLRCHPDFGFNALYTGPWDGQAPQCEGTSAEDTALLSGSFDPTNRTCSWVWAFSLNAYRRWHQSEQMH